LFLLGFGVLCAVFPNKAISQTIYDENLRPKTLIFLEPPSQDEVGRLYKEWQLTQKAEKLKGKYGGQCVTFARNFTGASPEDVSGMARNVKTNTTTPELGAIVKTDESKAGHLQVIIGIDGENLTVVDSNYGWDGIIRIRIINAYDSKILGYKTLYE